MALYNPTVRIRLKHEYGHVDLAVKEVEVHECSEPTLIYKTFDAPDGIVVLRQEEYEKLLQEKNMLEKSNNNLRKVVLAMEG